MHVFPAIPGGGSEKSLTRCRYRKGERAPYDDQGGDEVSIDQAG